MRTAQFRNKKSWLMMVVLLLCAAAVIFFVTFTRNDSPRVELAGATVEVEIADTPALRHQGLSGRTHLPEGKGMLFMFEESDFHPFHMKDMQFAIDIIWINEELEVIDITHDFQPDSYPNQAAPTSPARYVLEVPANFAERKGVEVGMRARLHGIE